MTYAGLASPEAAICAGCHGTEGISASDMFPNLAGQKAGYLESSLKAFRAKERTGNNANMMIPIAASLSDKDISTLAAYFADFSSTSEQ